jgi:hypothetical protein
MKLQLIAPLDGNSRFQNQEESRQLDWILATRLKVQNQAETPESPDLKNPGDWIGSSQLDWLIQIRQKLQSLRIQSTKLYSGDWIRANFVLMKTHLCFKALQIQGLLDPICLVSEVQIKEED